MDINSLPDESLLHIFSFLTPVDLAWGVRRTCKRWNGIRYGRCLWKRIHLYKLGLHNKLSPSSFIEFLRGISDRVQSLDFQKTKFDSSAYLHSDFRCTALKEIKLLGRDISMDTIQNLLTKYKDIESLTLSLNIKSVEGCLAVMQLLSELQKLKKLKIYGCRLKEKYPLTFDEARHNLLQLFKVQSRLESLSFFNCKIPQDVFKLAIDNNPELRELTLSMRGKLDIDLFSDGTALTKLETLDISGSDWDGDFLKTFAEKAPRLTNVYLSRCESLMSEKGISFLADHCRYLTSIVISTGIVENVHLTDAALMAIANSCEFLRHLNLNYCPEIGNAGMVALASGCKYLENLEMVRCKSLQDESFQILAENCSNLKKLNLRDCGEQITAKSVNEIIVKLKHLKFLNLNNCINLCDLNLKTTEADRNSEDSMDDSVNGATNSSKAKRSASEINQDVKLEERHSHIFLLCLGNSKISDECIRQMTRFCPDLRDLYLHECYNITDQSVELIAKSCKSLNKLDISCGFEEHLTKLTDNSLHSLAKLSNTLEYLGIMNNRNITVDGVVHVVANCPRIGLVSVSTREREQFQGIRLAFDKVHTKLIEIDVGRGMALFLDIYVQLKKAALQIKYDLQKESDRASEFW